MEHAKFYIAAKGFVFYGDRFLILKKYKYNEDGKWELPGGRLQTGETPQIALEREVWEETGLKVTVNRLLSTWSYRIDATEELVGLNYLCNTTTDFVSLSKEHTDYRWIAISEVNQYDFYQGVNEELHLLDIEGTQSKKDQSQNNSIQDLQPQKAAMIEEFKQVKRWKETASASAMVTFFFMILTASRFYLLGILGIIAGLCFAFYAFRKFKCPACGKQLDSRTEETFCPHCGVQLKELEEDHKIEN